MEIYNNIYVGLMIKWSQKTSKKTHIPTSYAITGIWCLVGHWFWRNRQLTVNWGVRDAVDDLHIGYRSRTMEFHVILYQSPFFLRWGICFAICRWFLEIQFRDFRGYPIPWPWPWPFRTPGGSGQRYMASQHHRHVHRWRDPQGWETAQIDVSDVSGEGERGTSIFTGLPSGSRTQDRIIWLWTNYHFYWLKLEKSWN